MKISEIVKVVDNITCFKDGDFSNLGMVTSIFETNNYLTFLGDIKYLESLYNNKNISAVIIKKDQELLVKDLNIGIIVSDNPKQSFYDIHNYFYDNGLYWEEFPKSIHESSLISGKAIIPNKNIKIGKNVLIEEGAIIKEGVVIGDNVIIRSGSIIGSVGFQYNSGEKITFVNSGGMVIVKDGAEIHYNVTIDKAIFGDSTIIGNNVKIDNLVHIGHDCAVGDNTLITAGVQIGGRTNIGENCWLGVNATISNGLNIGNNVRVSLGSVVTTHVKDDSVVTGNFAIDHKKFINFIKSIR